MNNSTTHDIIISGGGLVGLSLAVASAQTGFRVAIIEKNTPEHPDPSKSGYSARVSAINLASERFLTHIGAWQYIPTTRLSTYKSMRVWDGLGQGEINFDAHTVQHDHLGHIIENDFISAALWQCVDQVSNIDVLLEDTVAHWQQNNECVSIETHSGRHLRSKILVGSEGKHSPVRESAEIPSWQWSYNHDAIVTTIKHQKPHHQTAHQVFLDTGPLAFLPLSNESGNQNYSSIVWSLKSANTPSKMALSDNDFIAELNQAFEHRLGAIEQVEKRVVFPLCAQQAKTYFNQRVVILGDAAHTIHPLAGLGVNMGFLDAATLAEQWQQAQAQNIDVSHEFVLRRYQRQRQTHNLAVAGLMEGLKRLFDTQASAPVLIRNAGLNFLNRQTLLKRPLILAALGELGTPLPNLCR